MMCMCTYIQYQCIFHDQTRGLFSFLYQTVHITFFLHPHLTLFSYFEQVSFKRYIYHNFPSIGQSVAMGPEVSKDPSAPITQHSGRNWWSYSSWQWLGSCLISCDKWMDLLQCRFEPTSPLSVSETNTPSPGMSLAVMQVVPRRTHAPPDGVCMDKRLKSVRRSVADFWCQRTGDRIFSAAHLFAFYLERVEANFWWFFPPKCG